MNHDTSAQRKENARCAGCTLNRLRTEVLYLTKTQVHRDKTDKTDNNTGIRPKLCKVKLSENIDKSQGFGPIVVQTPTITSKLRFVLAAHASAEHKASASMAKMQ